MVPPIGSPGTADWGAIQAYQEMMARQGQQQPPAGSLAAGEMAPPPPPRQSADWVPMKPSNLPKLTPWPGLDPSSGMGPPLAPWDPAAQRRRIPWAWLLVIAVIGGLLGALALERRRADAAVAKAVIETPAEASAQSPSEGGTVAKAIPVEDKALPKECKLSPAESETAAKKLLERLFAATTAAERLACIDSPAKNAESVEDFFKRHPAVTIKALSVVTKLVRCLPSPAPQPIFDLTTNISNDSSGIVRLTSGYDGELKLDWLLLHDSLDGVFAAYQSKPPGAESQWVTLGLHRSYGFGEPSEMRETNLFFDMQGYGNGLDKTLVQTLKNTSTGRALDQSVAWGDLFIVRVLIGWQNFGGKPRLTVINALLDDTGLGS